MKKITKVLFFALFVLTGSAYADCPMVGGYRVVGHNFNTCTYASNQRLIGVHSTRAKCPRFILTDPHYKVVRCKIDQQTHRCVCVIAKKR